MLIKINTNLILDVFLHVPHHTLRDHKNKVKSNSESILSYILSINTTYILSISTKG